MAGLARLTALDWRRWTGGQQRSDDRKMSQQRAQATVDPPQKYETIASAIREPQDDHDAPAPAR